MIGTVVVAAASNAPPTVTAGRTPAGDVPRNTSVAFTATGADADGDTLTYAWDFGDGQTSDVAEPAHIYDAPGTYTAKVTVSDGKGGTAETTLSVTVTQPNRAPTVTAARTPTGNVADRHRRRVHRDRRRPRRRHAHLRVGLRRQHAAPPRRRTRRTPTPPPARSPPR